VLFSGQQTRRRPSLAGPPPSPGADSPATKKTKGLMPSVPAPPFYWMMIRTPAGLVGGTASAATTVKPTGPDEPVPPGPIALTVTV